GRLADRRAAASPRTAASCCCARPSAHLASARGVAGSLTDHRDPGRVQHRLIELIKTRVLAICCGYEDGNDLNRLAAGRCPESGDARCSQRTMGRLESPAAASRRGGSYGRIEPMIFSRETLSAIMPCLTAAPCHVRYQRVASATSGPASAPSIPLRWFGSYD